MTERNIADKQFFSYVDVGKDKTPQYAVRTTSGDGPAIDAFGRYRVSTPFVVFDNAESNGSRTDRWTTACSGAGTISYLTNYAAHKFVLSATTGDRAMRQGKRVNVYVPGTSILVLNTGVMGSGATNSSQRIGFFSDYNGCFFEQKNQVMGVVIRSDVTGTPEDIRVDQEDWNIDRMDGSGPSGIDLDFTKAHIFLIDLEWLGVGRVRFGFVFDGLIYYCHEVGHGNDLAYVYMSTANLPVRFETINTGASSAQTDFRQICSSVIIEGERAVSSDHRSVSNGVTPKAVTSIVTPILSMRLQTAYIGTSRIQPTRISTISLDSKDLLFQVIYNPTLSGASFANNSGIAAYDVAATSLSGGVVLEQFYSARDAQVALHSFTEQDVLGGSYDGVGDVLTIAALSVTGVASGRVLGAINYEEFY